MILYAERRHFRVPHAFDRVVVQIHVRYFPLRRQRIGRDREAVILRGDFDLASQAVQHRLIRAAMVSMS